MIRVKEAPFLNPFSVEPPEEEEEEGLEEDVSYKGWLPTEDQDDVKDEDTGRVTLENEKLLRSYITEIIRRCKKGDSEKGKTTCLYSRGKGGKKQSLLGRHKSAKSARGQERAIKARGG